ncbi:N-terminal acetyltransferase catalytic subunit [Tothia fuscella]|uniref:N-terminal acetyltransferase catalytic subunit n=1 Tax=Tothia fuscella TaxID=1048955 RepID=A0A9P4NSY6_9PEZI|nr:N-terminal acetyltransferase catalytic subunit [Tothia fuscella]
MPQPLNSKDAASFRQLVKLYEAKQHKKAVKTAEQILKKNPNHGDTLAMKALTLNAQGHTTEAFALAKTALQADMKSHICWHVYGLLYRSTKQLDEAIKAYKFALKLEPDSAQIQRDLAFLQIQMRDYAGYIESRKAMLQARPALRQNWTALAVAYHLSGDLESAEKHLKTYEDTLKTPPPRTDIEHSEAGLYRNSLLNEMGEAEKGLEHLETIYDANLDRTAVMEARAWYQLQLGQSEDAEKSYRDLVVRNNEYRPYYEGLEKAMGLDRSKSDDVAKLTELYKELLEGNDRLDAARRIPLDFLTGEQFKPAADQYLRKMLIKGVPSTFANIKALYSDPARLKTIQELVEAYTPETTAMNGDANQTNGDSKPSRLEESRLFFLAQHYNYPRSQNLEKALDYITKALEITPKSVDYNMTRARILKHKGDLAKASEIMNHARELDEKDRYINTKCAKYQLRNDENEKAIQTMSKFTRNETVGGPLGDLHDMQCMWFLTEDGEANFRQDKLSVALKRFKSIYDIFDVWQEDQFDFHHFSIRKGQIRAYVDMMHWEDRLREHPFYARAAINAIKIYVMLYDDPNLAHGNTNGVNLEGLNAADKKKALKKIKKEQERVAKEDADKRDAEKKASPPKKTGGDGEPKKEDPDPLGLTLIETKTPLDEAVKFLQPLLEFSPKTIAAQNWGFEVYVRRGKYLLALKCLIAAHSIDSQQAKLHEQLLRFSQTIHSLTEPLPPKVKQVLDANSNIIPEFSSLTNFNDAYLSKHKDCARRTQSGLSARRAIGQSPQSDIEKNLVKALDIEGITLKEALEGLELLKAWKSDTKAYVEKAKKVWPEASAFGEGSDS